MNLKETSQINQTVDMYNQDEIKKYFNNIIKIYIIYYDILVNNKYNLNQDNIKQNLKEFYIYNHNMLFFLEYYLENINNKDVISKLNTYEYKFQCKFCDDYNADDINTTILH
jgi:hypothetical protein